MHLEKLKVWFAPQTSSSLKGACANQTCDLRSAEYRRLLRSFASILYSVASCIVNVPQVTVADCKCFGLKCTASHRHCHFRRWACLLWLAVKAYP